MNPNHPAFPTGREFVGDDLTQYQECIGLTKREYLIALAMQSLLMNPTWKYSCEDITKFAIEQADDIIKQLNSENK